MTFNGRQFLSDGGFIESNNDDIKNSAADKPPKAIISMSVIIKTLCGIAAIITISLFIIKHVAGTNNNHIDDQKHHREFSDSLRRAHEKFKDSIWFDFYRKHPPESKYSDEQEPIIQGDSL